MRNSLLFFAAVSLLLASCQKEQLVEDKLSNGVVTEVSATFEALVPDGATKASVSISENIGTFSWQEDDAAAFVLDSKTAYGKGTYNATSQMFQIQGEANSHHDAVYPYDLVGSTSPSTEHVVKSVTVPSTREWAANQTNVAMYGTYTSDKYTFKHLGGLVKVTVVNVPTTAKTFVFKTAGKKINGTFTVEIVGGEKVIKTNSTSTGGEDIYTLNLPTTITANSTMDFYVPLPVGDGYKFVFYLKDDSSNDLVKIEGTTAQTVTRKSILVMPTITLAAASIEDIYKSATVQEVPAGHSGDFLLAKSEKVVLKVNTSTVDKDITLKYNGVNLPTNLKIDVVGDGHFDAKISGDLPYTHVDFTEGEIKEVHITTSGSTFNIIHPAKISDKLTVGGGNVVIEGAKVGAIEVVEGAKANPTTATGPDPVKITMKTATVESQEIKPEVVGTIVANADIKVAPAPGVEVFVAPAPGVDVTQEGDAGTVVEVRGKPVMIGKNGYDDLAAAINVVTEGQTIKVLNDISNANGISVPSGKNFTVDFGGHKYAVEKPGAGSTNTQTQAFQLLQESTIVFKNGTIECTAANKDYTWGSNAEIKGIAMIIQNYANLTLEDMTIDATNIAHNGNPGTPRYAVSNNCGTVEFKGNTTIKAPVAGDFAFDVCKFGSYSEPKVTWNSTGSVTGKIELTGGEFVVAKDLALTQPIRTKDAAAKLTVNANITPASGWNAGDALVIVNRTGNLTISGNGKISNNSNANVYSAVKMTELGEAADASDGANKAKLTVDGTVTLEGDYYGITGNGSRHGTEITVKGGTIRGTHTNDNLGIYHPQEGTLTITNGTIEGYSSAVEMRAGTLNITGGSFKSTATPYDFTQNGSGNTIKGVAIAISEHSTKKGITAKLDGGTFKGGAYQLGVEGLNDRINITKASNLKITVNSGYKWNDDNKLVVDAQQN